MDKIIGMNRTATDPVSRRFQAPFTPLLRDFDTSRPGAKSTHGWLKGSAGKGEKFRSNTCYTLKSLRTDPISSGSCD